MKKALVMVIGSVLLIAGCGGGGGGGDATTAVEPTREAPKIPATANPGGAGRNVPAKLRFEGRTLDGAGFDGTSLAGKPVVFWFWAPWCPKCLSEGPNVAKTAAKYEGKVSFVGIGGLDRDAKRLRGFVTRTGTGRIVHLDDQTGRLYSHFKVTTQSSFVFMKPDGTTSNDTGPLGESELSRHVDDLLG